MKRKELKKALGTAVKVAVVVVVGLGLVLSMMPFGAFM